VYKVLATIMSVNFLLKKKCVLYTCCIIVIYEPSARKHFSHMSSLFEARATKERVLHLGECAETFSRFEVVQYFLKQTLCPICRVPFDGACPCTCQSINRINSDLFSLFRNFQHPNWRNDVL
jgi:hypothetical protein